ncbi:hypothetical protein [Parafrankia sp. FMc2]|uniref:hypothetical protein n=1 Tax=Parafrankia sp. FMc2 TaxID=3233196 RepID=UPI0034D67897
MSAGPEEQGSMRRLRAWFGGDSDPRPDMEYVIVGEAFQTPSKGEAFAFSVVIRTAWQDGQRAVERIRKRAGLYASLVDEQVTVVTRCVLRSYPPNLAAEAETHLNAKLEQLARAGLPDTTLTWRARAEVAVAAEVQTLQQAAWTRALEQGALHEYSQQIVTNYTELATKWRQLLVALGVHEFDADQPPAPYLTRHLLRLAAQPQEAPNIVDRLAEQRESKDRDLLNAVAQAVSNTANVDLLEFELAHNSALSRLMEWAGLPVNDWSNPSPSRPTSAGRP